MVLVGSAVFAISVVAFFRVPLLPDIARDMNLSTSALGLITTVFAVGRLSADLPAGHFADRLGPLRMLWASSVLLAAGCVLFAVAPGAAWLWAASFVLGLASSVSNTTGMTYFSANASAGQRGRALALFSAALLGGQTLGPTAGGLLAGDGEWRRVLVVGALIAVVLILVLLPWRGRFAKLSSSGPPAHGAGGSAAVDLPPTARVALYGVPFAVFFTLGAMPQTLVPVIGDATFGLDARSIGLALGVGGLCRFIGNPLGGLVADRVSRKWALVPGLALEAAGVALLAADLGLVAFVAGIALMSLASFGISVAAAMLGDRSPSGGVGRPLGTFRFVGDLGLVAGPLVATTLFDLAGRRVAVLTVAAVLAASAVTSALLLPETAGRRHPAGAA